MSRVIRRRCVPGTLSVFLSLPIFSRSLIVDLFPAKRRGLAVGIYTASLYLGMGAAIAIGGVVLGLLRNSTEMSIPVLGALRTWQAAFVAVGLPGLAIALLACTLEEPARR